MRGRALASLVLLLVAAYGFEASGAMTAFEYDAVVSCCCGEHDAAHRCGCPTCPGAGRLRLAKRSRLHPPAPRCPSLRQCGGTTHAGAAGGVGSLPALAEADPIGHLALPLVARLAKVSPGTLADRLIVAIRPPP